MVATPETVNSQLRLLLVLEDLFDCQPEQSCATERERQAWVVLALFERIDRLLRRAQTCDLLVLPELCNSGYNFRSHDQAWETSEEVASSTFIRYLATVCREQGMHIVSGFNERDDGALYNAAVLVGPAGYIGTYRKLHLFMNEKDYFQPGNTGLPVFDIGVCTVGMLICFDRTFPEAWRTLALKGAEIVFVPVCSWGLRGDAFQTELQTRALENQIFVVAVNKAGFEQVENEDGGRDHFGRSCIVNPMGEIEAAIDNEPWGIVAGTIDLAKRTVLKENLIDLLNERRPELYDNLSEKRS